MLTFLMTYVLAVRKNVRFICCRLFNITLTDFKLNIDTTDLRKVVFLGFSCALVVEIFVNDCTTH